MNDYTEEETRLQQQAQSARKAMQMVSEDSEYEDDPAYIEYLDEEAEIRKWAI